MALLSLVAKLGLNTTGFDQGLSKAGKQASAFGSNLKSALAGAFSIAAIAAFLRGMEQAVGRIKDLSEQFAITTDEVQNVDFALKQSGLAFEDLAASMGKLGLARREAVEGNEELREVFAKYGLTIQQLNSPQMRNFDLLMMMADAMSRMNITAKEQVEIQDLLGPKAARLANVLATISQTKPPEIFTAQDIERIDKASKAIDNLVSSFQKMAAGPVARFAETLQQEVEKFKARGFKVTDLLFAPGKASLPSILNPLKAALFGNDAENAPAKGDVAPVETAKAKPAAADVGGLFEIDKNKKAIEALASVAAPTSGLRQADQLGRIGAFSGGPSNNVSAQLKKSNDTLTAIQRVLEVRGIKIQEL